MNEEKAKNNHKRRPNRHHGHGKKPSDRPQNQNQKHVKEVVPPPELPPLEAFGTSSFDKNEGKRGFRIGDPIDSAILDNVEIPEDYPFADDALLFPNRKREEALRDDSVEKTEIVGVRFKSTGKTYYFAPGAIKVSRGSFAIVETARGPEFGEVTLGNRLVPTTDIVPPLRPLLRIATAADIAHNEENAKKETDAFRICNEKIAAHKHKSKVVC